MTEYSLTHSPAFCCTQLASRTATWLVAIAHTTEDVRERETRRHGSLTDRSVVLGVCVS